MIFSDIVNLKTIRARLCLFHNRHPKKSSHFDATFFYKKIMTEYKQTLCWCGAKIEPPPSEFFLLVTHCPPQKYSKEIAIFTPYIKNLEIWSEQFLANFANALCNRMRWHGLSNGLPKWICYPFADWGEIGAFDGLLVDSIDYAIVKKIHSLCSKLKNYDNIDPLVYNNIKYFLHEKQRHCDPIGYAVGKNVQVAVQQAVEQSILTAQHLDNKGRIHNQTILTFSNSLSKEPCNEDALKTALGKTKWLEMQLKLVEMRKSVQAELCQIICQLAEQGNITNFKFGDLAKIMKDEVRLAWESSNVVLEKIEELDNDDLDEILHQLNKLIKNIKLDTTYEQWVNWNILTKEIYNDIDKIDCKDKIRQRISEEFEVIVNFIDEDQEPPSQAQLAKYLKIPKNTLNQDMKRLRKLFEEKWKLWTNNYKD